MAAPRLSAKVELSISARSLLDRDVFSKSDPRCVLFVKSPSSDTYTEFGRTETINDSLNPEFVEKFIMDFYFEERQHLKFELYDIDSTSDELINHDFLGSMTCTLGEIMCAESLTRNLNGPRKSSGSITVRGEERSKCRDLMTMSFSGKGLDKKDTFGKSDPYLTFHRLNDDGTYTLCHKTEVIKNTLDPAWEDFSVMLSSFCCVDYDKTIKVECWDWDRDGGHDFIGKFETTVRELSREPDKTCQSKEFTLLHPGKQNRKNYTDSGLIILNSAKIETPITFLEYIQGGCHLEFTIAIDFTQSNGISSEPNSLHYVDPDQPNHYIRAIRAVGNVLQDYKAEKLSISAYGFGARVPPDWEVSHDFHLNGTTSPICHGIDGVLDAYQKALSRVQLFGPTNFAPIINRVAERAACNVAGSTYHIHLIVTDGLITDMAKTKEAIVKAAEQPISIIIVGVGNENFEEMKVLDGDDVRISHQGKEARRDIVQFVPFRISEESDNISISQARLAKEVLAEIPDQLESYMKMARIKPNQKPVPEPPPL